MVRERSNKIEYSYQTMWLEDLTDDDIRCIANIIVDNFIERLEGISPIEKPSSGDNNEVKAA
jgi:hypothetical protein